MFNKAYENLYKLAHDDLQAESVKNSIDLYISLKDIKSQCDVYFPKNNY